MKKRSMTLLQKGLFFASAIVFWGIRNYLFLTVPMEGVEWFEKSLYFGAVFFPCGIALHFVPHGRDPWILPVVLSFNLITLASFVDGCVFRGLMDIYWYINWLPSEQSFVGTTFDAFGFSPEESFVGAVVIEFLVLMFLALIGIGVLVTLYYEEPSNFWRAVKYRVKRWLAKNT